MQLAGYWILECSQVNIQLTLHPCDWLITFLSKCFILQESSQMIIPNDTWPLLFNTRSYVQHGQINLHNFKFNVPTLDEVMPNDYDDAAIVGSLPNIKIVTGGIVCMELISNFRITCHIDFVRLGTVMWAFDRKCKCRNKSHHSWPGQPLWCWGRNIR